MKDAVPHAPKLALICICGFELKENETCGHFLSHPMGREDICETPLLPSNHPQPTLDSLWLPPEAGGMSEKDTSVSPPTRMSRWLSAALL